MSTADVVGAVDVAIVGCGPVGGVLATLLGRQGHSVVVVERHGTPYPLPRAVHFDHETARILQACGLGADLPEISLPGSDYEWQNATGEVLLQFGGRPVGPSGWPDMNMFWQPALEALIEAAARRQPRVEIRRGVRLVGLQQHTGHVDLALATEPGEPGTYGESGEDDGRTDGNREETLHARYVIGCDGANSTVRELIGGGLTDLGFFYDWLIVDLLLHEPRAFDPVNLQICDPARPTTAVSGGPGRRRWEFMRLPDEPLDDLQDPSTAWRLLEPWGITPDAATLERQAIYRFHARWADRWRRGRVLLAGDAAHQMPPFAGQGMCSGLRDAANLAWKLDLVLTGRAPTDLLDAYQDERAGNVQAVIDFSMSLGRVICVTDPDEAAERDAFMAAGARRDGPTIPPPLPGITAGIVAPGDPLAGQLFIQGRVADSTDNTDSLGSTGGSGGGGGGAVLLDEVAGTGWRLVTTDPGLETSLADETLDWFAGCGGKVVTVTDRRDVDGTYAAWFAENAVTAVLQRPDFHLFGSAPTTDDAGALLDALRRTVDQPRSLDAAPAGGPE